MIIYFSGTGNSRYIAEMAAEKLNDEVVDAGVYIKAKKRARLRSDRPWIFVAPTYSWQLPHIFIKFIKAAEFQGADGAYFIMTCGGDIGNAGEGIARLCEEKGFCYKGVLEVKMPENYLAMFSVPDREESDKVIRNAAILLEEQLEIIRKGQSFPNKKTTVLDRAKSGAVNTMFYRFCVKAKPFYAKDSCISCGKCEKVCPMNNIRLEDGRPVWGDRCTHCMACICQCPVEAIEYGKKSRGKRRYLAPVYGKDELSGVKNQE